jgi:hypothetical protein
MVKASGTSCGEVAGAAGNKNLILVTSVGSMNFKQRVEEADWMTMYNELSS